MRKIASSEILGAEIQYFRLEPTYWETIVRRFEDTGLRTVSTYVPWATHLVGPPDKKHPAGVMDFEGRTDERLNLRRFLELIETRGLDLIFRCGPFYCAELIHGGYPDWLVMGDPNMMVWDYQNRMAQGYWVGKKEGSQPSYLHPAYLEWCQKWFDEVDKIIVAHLKGNGGCITGVNLDNEVSYITQDGFLSADYNPVNVRPGGYYHQFLTEKYGKAENMPYPEKYANIEDVPAPRSVPEEVSGDFAYYADWCEFKLWAMGQYIRRLRNMHESNGVQGVLFMTNLNPHRPEGVPAGMKEFEEATDGVAGYDFYRGTFMSYSGYHSMARILKLMNAQLHYTCSLEFMSGTWNRVLPEIRVSDDHMRFMVRCALAHGCKAVNWYMFHDRDVWGDAPVSEHGHARPSLEVLAETRRLVLDTIRNWDALRPCADVAIVYDRTQHKHTYLGDPNPCDDNNLYVGAPTIDGIEAGGASREYEGLFRLVEQAGVQPAVIDPTCNSGELEAYPLVFLPGGPVVSESTSRCLEEYVSRGGALVVRGPWPGRNEYGREFSFLNIEKPRANDWPCSAKLGDGEVVWYDEYMARHEPECEDERHAASVASLIAKHVTAPFVKIETTEEIRWVDWAPGGGTKVYKQPRNLGSAVIHEGDNETCLFVLNHYPVAVRFRLEFYKRQYRLLRNLCSGEEIVIENNAVYVDIDRKSGWIYSLE